MNNELWSKKQNRPYREDEARVKMINGIAYLTDTTGEPLLTRVI